MLNKKVFIFRSDALELQERLWYHGVNSVIIPDYDTFTIKWEKLSPYVSSKLGLT